MSLETPSKIRKLQRELYIKAKREPEFRFYQLYDKVYREDILRFAYALSRENEGVPGVDGETYEDIESKGLREWLEGLRKVLHDKTYEPSAVRRVTIPKRDGGKRPLGIPTVRDRVVQTAAKLLLEPIFEADFEASAYGYRPKRSALDAVQEVHESLREGYLDVVDADLAQYFDNIPHHELMQCVARRVVDRQMLKLVKAWLKVPVEERDENGTRRMTGGKNSKRGTPQGGVVSPLLSNIYMNRYLKHWRRSGKGQKFRAKLINYADDFVILSRNKAQEALAWTRNVMATMGLSLNDSKTSIRDARKETFIFLGYEFGPECFRRTGRWYCAAQPAKKSVARIKAAVREHLHPGNQDPWEAVVLRLNQKLGGWANYFSYGTRYFAYRAVDHYVYDRVGQFLRRRHKVRTRRTWRFSAEEIYGTLGVLRVSSLPKVVPRVP